MKKTRLLLVLVILILLVVPVTAQADVGAMVEDFFADIETVLTAIAATAAFIGLVALGMIYVMTPVPFVASWKQKNPEMAQQVFWGLIILIFVSSGAAVGFLSF